MIKYNIYSGIILENSVIFIIINIDLDKCILILICPVNQRHIKELNSLEKVLLAQPSWSKVSNKNHFQS